MIELHYLQYLFNKCLKVYLKNSRFDAKLRSFPNTSLATFFSDTSFTKIQPTISNFYILFLNKKRLHEFFQYFFKKIILEK